jgi:hypothetical protein
MVQDVDNAGLKERPKESKLDNLDYSQLREDMAQVGEETTEAAKTFDLPDMSIEALEKTILDYDVFPKMEVVNCSDPFKVTGKFGTTESVLVRFKLLEPLAEAFIHKKEDVTETVEGQERTRQKWAKDGRELPVLEKVENYEGQVGIYFKLGLTDNLQTLEIKDPNSGEIRNVLEYYLITNRTMSYPFLRIVAATKGLIDMEDNTSSVKFFKNLILEMEGIQIQADFESSPGTKRLRLGGENFKLLNK